MGSKQFYIYSEGKNAEEAYQNAIREDQVRNGNKPYNGTISSKEVHSQFVFIQLPFSEDDSEAMEKYFKNKDKWDPTGCIEVRPAKGKPAKITVKHYQPQVKFQTRYVIYQMEKELGVYGTKKEALAAAKQMLADKTYHTSLTIYMEKRHINGNEIATLRAEPHKDSKNGRYLFFGWAPC
jgi:hypothetical protein